MRPRPPCGPAPDPGEWRGLREGPDGEHAGGGAPLSAARGSFVGGSAGMSHSQLMSSLSVRMGRKAGTGGPGVKQSAVREAA